MDSPDTYLLLAFQFYKYRYVMIKITDAIYESITTDETIVTDYIHPHSLKNGIPTDIILPPKVGGEFLVDDAVKEGKELFFAVR